MNQALGNLKARHRGIDAVQITAVIILLFLVVLLAYTFLHESGHLLVGLLFGARVTSFSINFLNLSAHVGLDGQFTPWQNGLISAAGVAFPLALWAIFISLTPRKGHILLDYLKLTMSMAFINALLAWVIIPILTLNGQTISDDSGNFLRYTQFPPLLVATGALFIYLGGLALYLHQAGGLRGIVRNLRSQQIEFASPQAKYTLAGLAICGALFTAAALGLGLAFGTERQVVVPQGYQPLASYDLNQTSFTDSIAYQFEYNVPARVSLFFVLSDIQGAPLAIRMTGPDGYDNVFFRVNDNTFKAIGQASVNPQDLALKPGVYHIRLTFPPGRGKIAIYLKQN